MRGKDYEKEILNPLENLLFCVLPLSELDINNISIKATTTDFLGFTGRSEGLAVHAISLLIKKDRLPEWLITN